MIGAVLAGLSIISGRKQAKAQKKAAQASNESTRLMNQQARLQALKQYRQARASVLSGVVNQGLTTEASGYQGVKGSMQSQLGQNLNVAYQQEQLGMEVARQQEKAAKYAFIGQALSMGSSIAEGIGTLKKEPEESTNASTFIS